MRDVFIWCKFPLSVPSLYGFRLQVRKKKKVQKWEQLLECSPNSNSNVLPWDCHRSCSFYWNENSTHLLTNIPCWFQIHSNFTHFNNILILKTSHYSVIVNVLTCFLWMLVSRLLLALLAGPICCLCEAWGGESFPPLCPGPDTCCSCVVWPIVLTGCWLDQEDWSFPAPGLTT